MLLHIRFKSTCLFWQQEAYWWKLELFLKSLSHSRSNLTEHFFPGEVLQIWVSVVVKLIFCNSGEIALVESKRKPVKLPSHLNFSELIFKDNVLQQLKFRPTIARVDLESVVLFSNDFPLWTRLVWAFVAAPLFWSIWVLRPRTRFLLLLLLLLFKLLLLLSFHVIFEVKNVVVVLLLHFVLLDLLVPVFLLGVLKQSLVISISNYF